LLLFKLEKRNLVVVFLQPRDVNRKAYEASTQRAQVAHGRGLLKEKI
jgi:hypothetical protein